MKNIIKLVLVLLMSMVLLLVACNKQEADDAVKIWMYRYADMTGSFAKIVEIIEDEITNYAEENDIKIEIYKFKDDELSLSDYVLKRNLTLEQGSVDIIIDDMETDIYQASEYAGDYMKLENYEKIFDNFKGHYCIPIGSNIRALVADRDVMKAYGVDTGKYITIDEYYEIKQTMKEKGARFRFDRSEYSQLVRYYIDKNKIKIQNENGKYILDRDTVRQTINNVSEDLLKYYDVKNTYYDTDDNSYEESIFDEISNRTLSMNIGDRPFCPLKFDNLTGNDELVPFDNYAVVICDDIETSMMRVPCLLINKNTSKENTYKVADHIFSDRFQTKLYGNTYLFSTMTESTKLKEILMYDDDWNYKYDPIQTRVYNSKLVRKDIDEIVKAVSQTYKAFKNIDTEEFYGPHQFSYLIFDFIRDESLKMLKNPNYIKDDFNKSFDDFMMNIDVSYN